MGAAWERHDMCESAFRVIFSARAEVKLFTIPSGTGGHLPSHPVDNGGSFFWYTVAAF